MAKHKIPGSPWHHRKASLYQLRMKRRPTRAERRFDDILDEALKEIPLPSFKTTQAKATKWHRKKRKFKKQRIFEDQARQKAYIVDFYIPALKLVIEIDGPSHEKQQDYDAVRSSFLATRGIKVLRFLNEETEDFKVCLAKVKPMIHERVETLDNRYKQQPMQPIEEIDSQALINQFLDNGGTITRCPTMKT